MALAHILAAFRDWRASIYKWLSEVRISFTYPSDSQLYMGGVIYFGLNCALASIGAFLPTIIKTFGFSKFYSYLLTPFLNLQTFFPCS